MLVSQPLPAMPSQLAKPALQESMLQVLLVHAAVPLKVVQWVPQVPQLFTSETVLTSHPFPASPSQFAKPALQDATPQVLLMHDAVPLAAVQWVPQAPQLFTSTVLFTSQPS